MNVCCESAVVCGPARVTNGGSQGHGHWQVWLREWQGTLMTATERNVPSVYSWLEAQVDEIVRANNLTQVSTFLVMNTQYSFRDSSLLQSWCIMHALLGCSRDVCCGTGDAGLEGGFCNTPVAKALQRRREASSGGGQGEGQAACTQHRCPLAVPVRGGNTHIFPALHRLSRKVVLLGHEPGMLTKDWRFGACR